MKSTASEPGLTTKYIPEVVVADQYFLERKDILHKNIREEQDYIAVQHYALIPLINLLNHRVNIMLR